MLVAVAIGNAVASEDYERRAVSVFYAYAKAKANK